MHWTAATGQRGIRRVDDGIRRHTCDVAGRQLQRFAGMRGPVHRLLLLSSYMAYEPGDRATIRSKQFLLVFGIALVIVLIAVAGILFLQRGAHVELKGSILKVRTMGMDDNNSLAVVDFRFANSSDYPFVVRSVDVTATGSDGQNYTSTPVPEVDAKRIFEYYPILGQKYNTSLLTRDKIPGQHSEDRMIVARFEVPIVKLDARTNLKIRIEDVDGPVSELAEK